jgi:hypothetical protein
MVEATTEASHPDAEQPGSRRSMTTAVRRLQGMVLVAARKSRAALSTCLMVSTANRFAVGMSITIEFPSDLRLAERQ